MIYDYKVLFKYDDALHGFSGLKEVDGQKELLECIFAEIIRELDLWKDHSDHKKLTLSNFSIEYKRIYPSL